MTNEKFRDILEAALQERYDSIPNPEDLDYDYEFSPEFEKKMQEMIENFSQIRKQAASEAKVSMDEKNGCRTSMKNRKRSESYGQKRIYNMHFRKALVIALVSALHRWRLPPAQSIMSLSGMKPTTKKQERWMLPSMWRIRKTLIGNLNI